MSVNYMHTSKTISHWLPHLQTDWKAHPLCLLVFFAMSLSHPQSLRLSH